MSPLLLLGLARAADPTIGHRLPTASDEETGASLGVDASALTLFDDVRQDREANRSTNVEALRLSGVLRPTPDLALHLAGSGIRVGERQNPVTDLAVAPFLAARWTAWRGEHWTLAPLFQAAGPLVGQIYATNERGVVALQLGLGLSARWSSGPWTFDAGLVPLQASLVGSFEQRIERFYLYDTLEQAILLGVTSEFRLARQLGPRGALLLTGYDLLPQLGWQQDWAACTASLTAGGVGARIYGSAIGVLRADTTLACHL